MREACHLDALRDRHFRHLGGDNRKQNHVLVEHLVVLEVVQEHEWRVFRLGCQEHRGAGNARGLEAPVRILVAQIPEQRIEGDRSIHEQAAHDQASTLPRRHQGENPERDDERHPTTLHDLEHVGGEEREIDDQEKGGKESGSPDTPLPMGTRQHVEENRRYRHRPCYGDSIRGGERARGSEHEHDENAPESKRAIHFGNEYLACFRLRGMDDLYARTVAKLHGLLRERERAGDESLRRDDRRDRREGDQRILERAGREQVERIDGGRRVPQDQCALSEVVRQ